MINYVINSDNAIVICTYSVIVSNVCIIFLEHLRMNKKNVSPLKMF